MISRKLVEIAFRHLILLILPIVALPAAVVALNSPTPQYQSSAVLWASAPPGGRPPLGHYNIYLTPAQNLATTINDLVGTDSFRLAVAIDAGIVGDPPPEQAPSTFSVGAWANGVNLLTISARAPTAEHAQAAVAATIRQFQAEAEREIQRDASLNAEYYSGQLDVAVRELEKRQAALNEYLRANPAAANPSSAASQALDYKTLVARIQDQTSTVETLRFSLQEVEFVRAGGGSNQRGSFAVRDEPQLPLYALTQSPTKKLGLPVAGLALGALIAASYLYLLFRTDHTIRCAEDLRGMNVPLLCKVPELTTQEGFARLWLIGRFFRMRGRDFARETATSISAEYQYSAEPGGPS